MFKHVLIYKGDPVENTSTNQWGKETILQGRVAPDRTIAWTQVQILPSHHVLTAIWGFCCVSILILIKNKYTPFNSIRCSESLCVNNVEMRPKGSVLYECGHLQTTENPVECLGAPVLRYQRVMNWFTIGRLICLNMHSLLLYPIYTPIH